MARPIPLELPKRDPREELHSRLEKAPAEHAEAILAGFEVLQGLHDRGVLELLRGVQTLQHFKTGQNRFGMLRRRLL